MKYALKGKNKTKQKSSEYQNGDDMTWMTKMNDKNDMCQAVCPHNLKCLTESWSLRLCYFQNYCLESESIFLFAFYFFSSKIFFIRNILSIFL